MIDLEFSMTRPSWVRNNVSNVFNTGAEHNQSFESKSESCMGDGSVFPKIQVPPVGFLV